MIARGELQDISLERLQLNLSNPRHEEVESRDEAMISLLQNEQIIELARDIVALGGINPMERMGVFPIEGTGDGEEAFYATAEGNRRLCALLLLDDPEAVPTAMSNRARYVRTLNQLSQQIDPILEVPCVVFESMDAARPWLERLHNGARDGTGRRRWTPEQQARNTGDRTNRAATQLRDLAIELGIVSADDLARTTTTQQRFISNGRFRQAMGLVRLEDGSLERTSCWPDFLIMLKQFMSDIADGMINSRSHNNRADIETYAQQLEALDGLQRRNVPQGPLELGQDEASGNDVGRPSAGGNDGRREDGDNEDGGGNASEDAESSAPEDEGGEGENLGPRPKARTTINVDDEIMASLHRLRNQKLIDLYQSLGTVRLSQHTLLAVIGCWSFFESMTMAHGRKSGTEFVGYINGAVKALGVDTEPTKNVRQAMLGWIQVGGNITKHDWQAAAYDPKQLCNAMDTLKPIIVAMLDDISDRAINP